MVVLGAAAQGPGFQACICRLLAGLGGLENQMGSRLGKRELGLEEGVVEWGHVGWEAGRAK